MLTRKKKAVLRRCLVLFACVMFNLRKRGYRYCIGRYIIIIVSNSGKLYRIERSTRNINEIQVNAPVTSVDGLLLEGSILYVSRNATGQIFPVTLNSDYTQGTVGAGFGSNLLFNTDYRQGRRLPSS